MKMQTQEELLVELTVSALNHWMAAGKKPANLLVTENNSLFITSTISKYIQQTGRKPSVEEVDQIIKSLGDIALGGKLQYHGAAVVNAVDPTLNFPDADEPLLKNLRCLEDIEERGEQLARKILSRGDGVGGTDEFGRSRSNELLEKFNRRTKYIADHNIQR